MRNGNYIMVVATKEYAGKKYRGKYCYEHQLVWWKHNKKSVPDGYSIHHINEDKYDNRIENLQLVSNSFHGKIHAKKVEPKILNCSHCSAEFKIRPHNYNHKLKMGQKQFFCSRKCIGLYNYRKIRG